MAVSKKHKNKSQILVKVVVVQRRARKSWDPGHPLHCWGTCHHWKFQHVTRKWFRPFSFLGRGLIFVELLARWRCVGTQCFTFIGTEGYRMNIHEHEEGMIRNDLFKSIRHQKTIDDFRSSPHVHCLSTLRSESPRLGGKNVPRILQTRNTWQHCQGQCLITDILETRQGVPHKFSRSYWFILDNLKDS